MKIQRILSKFNTFLMKKYNVGFVKNYPLRTSISFAKNYFKNKKVVCAEIGTFGGENAKNILEKLNVEKIYLIDPWDSYEGYSEYNHNLLNKYLQETKKRLKKFSKKIIFVKKYSHEAIKTINSKLDFVYIDGNHDYKYVKKDIELYWKKLRKGGILAGHDISWPGVSKAFCEFVEEHKLDPHISKMDWWIVKG